MLVNGRFEVDPLRNEIIDRQTGKLNRLEPRLMKLLCLLIELEGKAVSRKTIIKEVWNDYPGGDEGLNQAISVLRKLLDDGEKRIIETLPKIGYCFHAAIGACDIVPKRKAPNEKYLPAALVLLAISILIVGYFKYRGNGHIVTDRSAHEESVRAYKIDAAGKAHSKDSGRPIENAVQPAIKVPN